ncbi:hypothetical protein AAG570_004997 [Ranatra chinensis]|uniref:Uncharacterized protein n=1 Tax=Ranatra chinensis TaxID=642074 RepID=A0ABD0YMR0_9HEMI
MDMRVHLETENDCGLRRREMLPSRRAPQIQDKGAPRKRGRPRKKKRAIVSPMFPETSPSVRLAYLRPSPRRSGTWPNVFGHARRSGRQARVTVDRTPRGRTAGVTPATEEVEEAVAIVTGRSVFETALSCCRLGGWPPSGPASGNGRERPGREDEE